MKKLIALLTVLALMISAAALGASAAKPDFSDKLKNDITDAYLRQANYDETQWGREDVVVTPYYSDGRYAVFGIYIGYANGNLEYCTDGDLKYTTSDGLKPFVYSISDGYICSFNSVQGSLGDSFIKALIPAYCETSRFEMFNRFDIDRDGSITVSDLVTERGLVMSAEYNDISQGMFRYDVDSNGYVTVSDVVLIREYILNH